MSIDVKSILANAQQFTDDELEELPDEPAPTRRGYTRRKTLARRKPGDWDQLLEQAADIVNSYSTPVTLRQLHYRLVSDPTIAYENLATEVTQLSHRTARARREGTFPQLSDPTRSIDRPMSWDSVTDAKEWLSGRYRKDRTKGQPYALYLVIEKAALRNQLWDWFSKYGIPVVALRGYASQGHIDEILDDVATQVAEDVQAKDEQRPAIALYAGDYDPSGKDILRDFSERAECFDEIVRVALTAEQVEEFELPINPGKATDSRMAKFIESEGGLYQVELDALPPTELRRLYQEAINEYWDDEIYKSVLATEKQDRRALSE